MYEFMKKHIIQGYQKDCQRIHIKEFICEFKFTYVNSCMKTKFMNSRMNSHMN